MSNEQMVVLPVSVFNQVTEFITTQPYSQVAPLIDALKENTKLVESPAVEEEVSEEGE